MIRSRSDTLHADFDIPEWILSNVLSHVFVSRFVFIYNKALKFKSSYAAHLGVVIVPGAHREAPSLEGKQGTTTHLSRV